MLETKQQAAIYGYFKRSLKDSSPDMFFTRAMRETWTCALMAAWEITGGVSAPDTGWFSAWRKACNDAGIKDQTSLAQQTDLSPAEFYAKLETCFDNLRAGYMPKPIKLKPAIEIVEKPESCKDPAQTDEIQARHEAIAAANEEALTADGLDAGLIGIVQQFSNPPIALYDRAKCIQALMNNGEMDYEEAAEFFDVNVQGSWMGPNTPAFAVLFNGAELDY